MLPSSAADLRDGDPGAKIVNEGKKKRKRNKKKRPSNDLTSRSISSSGDHDNTIGAEASPPRRHRATKQEQQPKESGAVALADVGGSDSPVAATPRARRNSEDTQGGLATDGTGGVNNSSLDEANSSRRMVDQDDGIAGMGDDDDDQDEGVVIQRERPPTPTPTHGTAEKKKKKKNKKTTGNSSADLDEPSSGIPFALPSPGTLFWTAVVSSVVRGFPCSSKSNDPVAFAVLFATAIQAK